MSPIHCNTNLVSLAVANLQEVKTLKIFRIITEKKPKHSRSFEIFSIPCKIRNDDHANEHQSIDAYGNVRRFIKLEHAFFEYFDFVDLVSQERPDNQEGQL